MDEAQQAVSPEEPQGTEPPKKEYKESEWQDDESRIRRERRKEPEWRKLAEDLQAKNYLSADADLEAFIAECRTYASDDDLCVEVDRCAQGTGASFSMYLTAGAVLAREAFDIDLKREDLSELDVFRYPDEPTKNPTSLRVDVRELAAWISVLIEHPLGSNRVSPKDIADKHTYQEVIVRLNEIGVRCYCALLSWEPPMKAAEPPKKKRGYEEEP